MGKLVLNVFDIRSATSETHIIPSPVREHTATPTCRCKPERDPEVAQIWNHKQVDPEGLD